MSSNEVFQLVVYGYPAFARKLADIEFALHSSKGPEVRPTLVSD